MDEGLPIAYEVLEKGVPVLASDGEQVGTVHHVVAAPEKDIFHGLVITRPSTGGGSSRPPTSHRCTNAASTCGSTRPPRRPARAGRRGAGIRRGPRRDEGLASLAAQAGHARRLAPRALSARQPRRMRDRGSATDMSTTSPARFRRAPSASARSSAVAAGGALLPGAARARGGGLRAAHALSARPRQDRALQGVSPADAQDAGVRGAARATTTARGSPTRSRSPRSRARSRARCA